MKHLKYLAVLAAACAAATTTAMAQPGPIEDGPGAAKIVDDSFSILASPTGENPILRQGNAKFGLMDVEADEALAMLHRAGALGPGGRYRVLGFHAFGASNVLDASVLAAGLTWEWETFSEFMDELERRPRAIDIAAQAAHLPLRVYVMGDRAIRREPATPDDIAEMRRLTIEALRAGAFGFTT